MPPKTERRCKNGHWHDKTEPCPKCGDTASPFNKGLRTAQLNSHLYDMAERS